MFIMFSCVELLCIFLCRLALFVSRPKLAKRLAMKTILS